jgi:hypothetical protein
VRRILSQKKAMKYIRLGLEGRSGVAVEHKGEQSDNGKKNQRDSKPLSMAPTNKPRLYSASAIQNRICNYRDYGTFVHPPSTPTTRPIQSMTDRLEPRITQHSLTHSWAYLRRTNRWKGGYTPVFDPAFHSLGGGWDRMRTE